MANPTHLDLSAIPSKYGSGATISTPPKALRMVDAELMKIEGIQCAINESFRLGVAQFDVEQQRVVLSSGTLNWLDATERKGGPEWGSVSNLLRTTIRTAERTMQTQMVDLTKVAKVVDRRRVTRPAEDRVELVCRGISDLTAQMSGMLSGRVVHNDAMVAGVAKRYSALAAEMAALREALTNAEGMFEIAQVQVVQLMEGE
jgi:hypothetical protein